MSYYPYYNYGYMPNGQQPCSDNTIQYQAQQQQQQEQGPPCPTDVKYYQIDGCRPFDPCSLDYEGPSGVTGTILFLNKEKTAYTSSDNFYYDPDAHNGLGKLYVKGGLDPIYAQLEPQASNPNVGQTGTIWYNRNDNKLYLDNNALLHNTSNYVQLKKQITNPNSGATGTIWIKDGENALYLDDTIITGGGGGAGGNAATSGGLGPGATGTSITLFSSQANPRPEGIPESDTECPPGKPGTLWVNCDGSLMFNNAQVIGPNGSTIYANDPWMYKYILDQPPEPIVIEQRRQGLVQGQPFPLKDYLETYSTVSIKWTPPEQIRVGMIDEPIPVIRKFKILLIDQSNTANQIYLIDTSLSSTVANALLTTQANELILHNTNPPGGQPERYNITGTNPLKVINYYLGGITPALVGPFTVKIWYENNSKEDINQLVLEDVNFIPPGPPSAPNIQFSTKSKETITITATKGEYTDSENQLNEVNLSRYFVYYRAITTQKVGITLDITENRLEYVIPITSSTPYQESINITGLLPLTTYEISVSAKNNRNANESARSSNIIIETLGPTANIGEQVSSTNLNSKFPSIYREAYRNGILLTNPVVYSGQAWKINIGPYYASTNPSTVSSVLDVQINAPNNVYDILDTLGNNPTITYNRNTTQPNIRKNDLGLINNKQQTRILLYNGTIIGNSAPTNEAIFDPNNNQIDAGLFLQAYSGMNVNISGFLGSYDNYNLEYRIKLENPVGTINEFKTNTNFYVDDLPLTEKPLFLNITGNADERIIYENSPLTTNVKNVCGIAMINGNWRLRIGRIKMEHTVYYFHYNPILQYDFAEKNNEILLSSVPDIGTNGEYTFLNSIIPTTLLIGKYIDGMDNTFRYRPSLTLHANNINKDQINNRTSTTFIVKTIIDKPSIDSALTRNNNSYVKEALISEAECFSTTIINQLNTNGIQTDDNIFNGQRMLTSRATNILTDYETARTPIDNDYIDLSYEGTDITGSGTGRKISGKNDLIMINGKFMTGGYTGTGSEGAYRNYATEIDGDINRPDYEGLKSETKYRYVTMRWKYRTNAISGLAFKIVEIDSTPAISIQNNKGVVIGADQSSPSIQLYYRIEEPSKNSGNPSNIPFTQTNNNNISSVWINANSTVDNDKFSRWLGLTDKTGLIGGIDNISKITIETITDSTLRNVIYKVTAPIVNLGVGGDSRDVNIYAIIGVPMNANIAFKELQCCLINSIGLTMPSLQGGVYIDGITKDTANEYRVGNTYGMINGVKTQITAYDIILYDVGAPRQLVITPPEKVYISPSETTTQSEIQAEITVGATTHFFKFKYDQNADVQTDNTVTSTQSSPTIITLQHQQPSTIIRDIYEGGSAYQKNYFMYTLIKALLNIRDSNLSIQDGLTKYEIKLRYIYSISGVAQTDKIKIFNLYLDKLPTSISGKPVINSFVVQNAKNESNADTIFVTGVPVNNGNWSLLLNNINTSNVIYWYYYSPIIQYTFLNSGDNQTLIADTTKSSATGQIIFADKSQSETDITISSTAQYQQFIYKPEITLKANNINITNNLSDNKISNVEMILDYPSYNLLYNPTNSDRYIQAGVERECGKLPGTASTLSTIIENSKYGKLMKTSTQLYTATTTIKGIEVKNIFTDYSTSRTEYDNTENIAITATNSLQIMNGMFITKAYTISSINNSSYRDYSAIKSGVNYNGIDTTGYRWATFRWQVLNAKFNKLQIAIDSISLGSGTTLKEGTDRKLKVNKGGTDKNIELYYRFEQLAHNTTIIPTPSIDAKDPQNVTDTATNRKNISSIWINANDFASNGSFASRLGLLEYSGSLSGIAGNESDIQIASDSTYVMYNVNCPSIDLSSSNYPDKRVNIYVMIGLPMDMDISIKGIKTYVYSG